MGSNPLPCHSKLRKAMIEFSEFITKSSLMDLPLIGGIDTWSNNHMWSRLDRFLESSDCESHFSNIYQKRLTRLGSNHFPILLDCDGYQGVVSISNLRTCWSRRASWKQFGNDGLGINSMVHLVLFSLPNWKFQKIIWSFGILIPLVTLVTGRKGMIEELKEFERIQED